MADETVVKRDVRAGLAEVWVDSRQGQGALTVGRATFQGERTWVIIDQLALT